MGDGARRVLAVLRGFDVGILESQHKRYFLWHLGVGVQLRKESKWETLRLLLFSEEIFRDVSVSVKLDQVLEYASVAGH